MQLPYPVLVTVHDLTGECFAALIPDFCHHITFGDIVITADAGIIIPVPNN